MDRKLIVAAAFVGMTLTIPGAMAQSLTPKAGPRTTSVFVYTNASFDRGSIAPLDKNGVSPAQAVQARRWQRVGQCVAARDRDASLAYVTDGSRDAARALKPAFRECLTGSGVDVPGSMDLRRASLADALGVPLKR